MSKFEQDKIGRKEIVDKICKLVDNLTKGKYFCAALDGQWGSGKSFVLEMIEETLSQHNEYVIIKYDAWENSFYEDPLIAILSCVIDRIQSKLSEIDGFQTVLKEASKDVFNRFIKSNKYASTLVGIIKSISSIIKRVNNPFSKDTSKNSIVEFKSYQNLLTEVKESLNSIVNYNEFEGKQNRLIILVDELDRCLPNEQLRILERLHHLFDVENCAVIVALNMDSVAANVNSTFGVDGKEYLRKFFDFSFKLQTSSEEYLYALLKCLAEDLHKINNKFNWEEVIKSAFYCLKYGDKNVLNEIENREVTRYYEALFKTCSAFGLERLTDEYVFFIILAIYIRKNIDISFLSKAKIQEKQKVFDKDKGMLQSAEMPYFDYVKNYIGIERNNIHKSTMTMVKYAGDNISAYIWGFNEIIYYSLGNEFDYNEIRVFMHQNTVNISDCQQLRNLVMLYSGGEE